MEGRKRDTLKQIGQWFAEYVWLAYMLKTMWFIFIKKINYKYMIRNRNRELSLYMVPK